MKGVKTWLAAALAAVLAAGAASAEQVRLTTVDTGYVLAGELLRYDGEVYVIRSSIGELTVTAGSVRCDGPGCPEPAPAAEAAAPAAAGDSAAADGIIGVFGSNIIGAELMPGLIEAYSESVDASAERVIGADPRRVTMLLRDAAGLDLAEIDLRADGSADAIPALIAGEATIGMSSRPASAAEIDDLAAVGVADISDAEHVLALDGLVAIVAPGNARRLISIEELAAVFSGRIGDWAELGAHDAPINVYMREAGSGARDLFESRVLAPFGAELTPRARVVSGAGALSDAVAADPDGIGVTGFAFVRNARALALALDCGLIVEPSAFNVKTEEYPLARRLYLYTAGAPHAPHAGGLLSYALSDAAQDVIAELGFVDQSIDRMPLNQQGRRFAEAFLTPRDEEAQRAMRDLALELLDAERLSITARFGPDSVEPEAKSRDDIARLARALVQGAFAGRELLLVGFADDSDRFGANLAISRERAAAVRALLVDEVAALGGGSQKAELLELGYADLAPVGCGDDSPGGVSNRRVELWVRDRL